MPASIKLSWSVSRRAQINIIFTNNICLLCSFCNVKKSKIFTKFPEKSRNEGSLNCFKCVLDHVHGITVTIFYCSHYMNQVPVNVIFWSVTTSKRGDN